MNAEEQVFLQGPKSRTRELIFTIKVAFQFINGFRKFHFLGPCITVFGSSRFNEDHPFYQLAREVGFKIAKLGFNIMTGGGPGIMEAANRGAKDAGGKSIGCNIVLSEEQTPNQYLDKWVNIDYFFIRKVLLSKYSCGYIVMPGGYGTLDEFFEALTLIQTNKIRQFPIVLFGSDFHGPLYDYLKKLVDYNTISNQDLHYFLLTDSVDEAVEHIRSNTVEKFNRVQHESIKPLTLLGEK